MYLLCMNPPSWVAVGYPNRTWYKVPDEGNSGNLYIDR